MTTVVADIITAPVAGNPVKCFLLDYNDPLTPTNNIQFKLPFFSHPVRDFILKSAATVNRTVTIPNNIGKILGIRGFLLSFDAGIQTFGTLKTDKISNAFGAPFIFGKKDATVTISNDTIKIANRNIVLQSTNASSTTILKSTTASGATADIILPSTSSTLISGGVVNNFTGVQTFLVAPKTNSISASGVNTNLVLNGNGTGNVVIANTLAIDAITAKTLNGNLNFLSDGVTGIPNIGFTGLKFLNEALAYYSVSSFASPVTCGTFNSGIVTFQYERLGNRVMIRVPAVSGTPNVDTTFTTAANSLPVDLRPSLNQILIGGMGIKNGLVKTPIYVTIFNTGFLTFGHTTDTGGFGTAGTCGWTTSWSFTYLV